MAAGRQHLSHAALEALIRHADLTDVSVEALLTDYREEPKLQEHLPDGQLAVDPRTGDRVIFNPSRARRPRQYKTVEGETEAPATSCPICAGETTGVIDLAPLSEGATFINKNLFPMLYPFEDPETAARGLHYLQWTSTYHDRDWHNMPASDRQIVLRRLAALEAAFIQRDGGLAPQGEEIPYVTIIKNAGAVVGASLSHGHQQIAIGNAIPSQTLANLRFIQEHGGPFSAHLLASLETPLVVRDYGPAVLLVPPFMKRPYHLILVLKDVQKAFLHQLEGAEVEAVAEGVHDATRAFHELLPRIGRQVAYNFSINNGPGAGLYLEFQPYSQTTGGFERMGLYICQSTPQAAAEDLRAALSGTLPS